ncbi:hypothetical protein ROLI_000730 [Roseobacter fucihabitans]|uniref:Uncharacterized protein n=1 Tax=Roseobacter fucihabitans TaxID=1537242 RepID=A0ABZ2BLI9_9RHOB|nr:hypothetical protein [Roseobacter litoralis]MBC6966468.1 hypothetical protein [Roseobacter litoralis]
MNRDWERNCLMSMADKHQRQGLCRADAIRDINATLCGFSTCFHIIQAVNAAYDGPSRNL